MTTKYRLETATVPFGFAVNAPDGTGATDADSTPTGYLREAGATASDAPITTGVTVQLLSNAGYPAGLYEVIVNGTTASLSADTEYEVYVSATVDTVVCTGMIGTLVTTPLLDAAGIRTALGMASATYDTDIANLPTTAEFEARTIVAANYALESTADGIATTLGEWEAGTTLIPVNVTEVSGDATAADNLELQFDGTGLTGDTFPATQLALATVDTEVGAIDTVVDAVKAKTDQLTFGVANVLNANITHVNETEVTGDGETGTEWNPV